MVKKIIGIIISVMIVYCFTGCTNENYNNNRFTTIEYGSRYEIVTDTETNIVYISYFHRGLCPYYSENGKLVKYIDNEMKEIE